MKGSLVRIVAEKMVAPQKQKCKRILFLFLLLSLSSLVLFSISPSNSNPKPQFQSQIHQTPNPSHNFTFIIKLLTFNRLSSLTRCLNSLSNAQYDNDQVQLHIFVDHFQSMNRSSDLDSKLDLSKRILDFVDGFEWRFGPKLVHYRTSNVGLQAQWLEAWWPASDHEFAFVVEDDLELSPLYYRFLKGLILNYYYNATNFSPSLYGASLQRPRFVPGKHGNKMQLDGEARIFLYHLVGTWGQLLFPRPWKEFRLWYDTHKAKGMKPLLDGMVTTGWYKRIGEKIWTPWFIKFIQSRGYFNIYTNFPQERALSISHRDAGVNYGKTAGPDSYLLDDTSTSFNLFDLYPLNDLKWYDFCFREVVTNRIVNNSDALGSVLQSVQKKNSVIIVSLYRVPEPVIRNMLCHFEGLNIQNYILVGPTSNFLLDLARRGHPVIDGSQFTDSIKLARSINFQDSTVELMKEILLMSHVVKKSLDLGYSSWVLDGNILPRTTDSVFDYFDQKSDFHIGKTSRLLFVRSSSSSVKIWSDNFVYKVAAFVDTLRKDSVSRDHIFFNAVEKLLDKLSVSFSRLDETPLCLDVGSGHADSTSLKRETKFMFWSSGTELNVLQKQLKHLTMWGLDGDLSCTAVVCHPS